MSEPAGSVRSVKVCGATDPRQRARVVLKADSAFAKCSDAVIDDIMARAVVVRLAKGEIMYRQGEPGDNLMVVLSGSLKVVNVTADAKEVVLAFLKAGALIGEIAVLDGHPRTASVVAMDAVEAVALYRRDLLPILRANPDALLALLEATCARLRTTIALVESYGLETEARVAACLLRLAGAHGRKTGRGTTIEFKINQQDLGSHLGFARETISRTLSDFRGAGLIELSGALIVILDLEGLALLAEGGEQ